jgi:hypothetical protein
MQLPVLYRELSVECRLQLLENLVVCAIGYECWAVSTRNQHRVNTRIFFTPSHYVHLLPTPQIESIQHH